ADQTVVAALPRALATLREQALVWGDDERLRLALAGRVVRGRIDAVYKHGDGDETTYEIVDWKTSRTRTADPLQLAVYRLAWAEQQGVPPESVTAAFLYVRSGEVVRPPDLPDRAALERLLTGEAGTEGAGTEDAGVTHRTS
ncbi:PD-(D/E)XK nuclease family protein, partial [Streptomyces sp. NPDC001130]